jgi:hypothetical protein
MMNRFPQIVTQAEEDHGFLVKGIEISPSLKRRIPWISSNWQLELMYDVR